MRKYPPQQQIEQCIPLKSRQSYARKIQLYSGIASTVYRIPIDQQTQDRWTDLIMLGRAGDTYLDTAHDPDEQQERLDIFTSKIQNDEFAETYPSLSKEALGVFDKYAASVTQLTQISLRAKACRDIHDHMRLRLVEGVRTADLVSLVASSSLQQHPNFSQFTRDFRYAGAWSTLGNSCIGFFRDTATTEIAVPYSIGRQLELLKTQVHWGLYFSARSLKQRLATERG